MLCKSHLDSHQSLSWPRAAISEEAGVGWLDMQGSGQSKPKLGVKETRASPTPL